MNILRFFDFPVDLNLDGDTFRCPLASVKSTDKKGQIVAHPKYAHETDCQKFYVCLSGIDKRVLGCPSGQVYNDDTEMCDDPENVPGWWVCHQIENNKMDKNVIVNWSVLQWGLVQGRLIRRKTIEKITKVVTNPENWAHDECVIVVGPFILAFSAWYRKSVILLYSLTEYFIFIWTLKKHIHTHTYAQEHSWWWNKNLLQKIFALLIHTKIKYFVLPLLLFFSRCYDFRWSFLRKIIDKFLLTVPITFCPLDICAVDLFRFILHNLYETKCAISHGIGRCVDFLSLFLFSTHLFIRRDHNLLVLKIC